MGSGIKLILSGVMLPKFESVMKQQIFDSAWVSCNYDQAESAAALQWPDKVR
jgi:hypothetical protein